MSRKPTVDELGDLLVKTLWALDKACLEYLDYEDETAFRKVYTDTLAAACELIGTSEDDWECIFDIDRPKEEWKLLENVDLLALYEGAD